MNILFTICGRAGSKGFKNKNIKRMNGVALVNYTVAAIKLYTNNHPEDQIIVALNTDSQELQDQIKNQHIYEDIKIIERKPELAGDLVAKVDVIRDTYYSTKGNDGFDIVIDLDITSPLRTLDDIEKSIREYNSNPDYDLVFSVVEARRSPYFNMVEKKDEFYRKIISSNYTARQQAPKSYEMNASIYVYDPSFLERNINNTISENRCGITVMKDYLVLDIDSEEDFHMMEFLHRFYCENDDGIREVYNTAKESER